MPNDMNPQELLAAARALLTAEQAPMNTANLNRAMAALSQGQTQLPAMSAADSYAPTARRRATPQAAAQPTATPAVTPAPEAAAAPPMVNNDANAAAVVAANVPAVTASVDAAPTSGMDSMLSMMLGEDAPRIPAEVVESPSIAMVDNIMSGAEPTRGDAVNARVASGRRIGSASGARPFTDETAGAPIVAGSRERLATDVEDPTGLGLTLLAMGAGGIGTAARLGAPVAESLGAQASRLVAGDRAVRATEATQAAQQAASRSIAEQARMGTRGTVPTPPKPRVSVRADSRPSAPPAQSAVPQPPAPQMPPTAPSAPPSIPRDNTLIPSSGRPDIVPAPPLVPPRPVAPPVRDNTLVPSTGRPSIVPAPSNIPMGPPSAAEIAAMSGRNMQGGGRNLAQGPRRGTQGTTPESPSTMNVPASIREAMRRRIFESIR